MDLSVYLVESVVSATTPPSETTADAHARVEAITAMLCAYRPATHLEAMMASQCIMMQFLFNAAMRDASNPQLEPAALARARADANSASRTLHQWVSKFEKERKRNEILAAEAAKAQAAPSKAKPEEPAPSGKPAQTPVPAPAARAPVPDSQTPAAAGKPEPPRAAAANVGPDASGHITPGSHTPPAAAHLPPAKLPVAA